MADHKVTVHQLVAGSGDAVLFVSKDVEGGVGVSTYDNFTDETWRVALYVDPGREVHFLHFNDEAAQHKWETRHRVCKRVWPAPANPTSDTESRS